MSESTAIIILLASFLIMVFLRFPIAYSVAISTLLCLSYMGLPLATLTQQMVKGISSFSLMAVPFFITMGVLMGSGGISEKLLNLADACVGWMTGGLAMVNIVASYFFGGISGSASADTASLGSLEIPMMVNRGYDVDFATAVTISSSVEGMLVPPSHNMVIYATLRHHSRRTFRRKPVPGRISSGRGPGRLPDGPVLHSLQEERLSEGRALQPFQTGQGICNFNLGAVRDPDRCRRCLRRCLHRYRVRSYRGYLLPDRLPLCL